MAVPVYWIQHQNTRSLISTGLSSLSVSPLVLNPSQGEEGDEEVVADDEVVGDDEVDGDDEIDGDEEQEGGEEAGGAEKAGGEEEEEEEG
ncbi:unnamed protein product [Acanthoscelides obtectus]|uniref:Uncharacterized protein n=1 Tax=Acanthoscelides obtectus TaxID=200917 RepID=A0A9P0KKL0_ACAOB|nr:unnamed protein product [Acanthoscelides obtectus]CAK1626177.1 hypothetical protein AOBTE_LOCUS3666 [Acanthoscelides obtectus]